MLALPPASGYRSVLYDGMLVTMKTSVHKRLCDIFFSEEAAVKEVHGLYLFDFETGRGLKVMNGRGDWINTIDGTPPPWRGNTAYEQ